jgi:hypothetical protein
MRRIFPFLLIGCLSMLFAEVFSGASQAWFISPFPILITLPLYFAHVLFFLLIGMRFEKMSLRQLYIMGIIFGLYEAWITKVLWAGYFDVTAPAWGTFLGIAVAEFPVLVLFWHPIMSFIVPVLSFGILTGKGFTAHASILRKSMKKSVLIIIFLFLAGAFLANGNKYDIFSANLSLLGSLAIIFILFLLSKKYDYNSLRLGRIGFCLLCLYLALLYAVSFFGLLPQRIPNNALPYISILAFYALAVILLLKSGRTPAQTAGLGNDSYSAKHFFAFMLAIIFSSNLFCLIPQFGHLVLAVSYVLFWGVGMVIFIWLIAGALAFKKFLGRR